MVADLATWSISERVILPPMSLITSMIPVRVSLIPTFSKTILELGTTSPATNQKAAEEMSPGTTTS